MSVSLDQPDQRNSSNNCLQNWTIVTRLTTANIRSSELRIGTVILARVLFRGDLLKQIQFVLAASVTAPANTKLQHHFGILKSFGPLQLILCWANTCMRWTGGRISSVIQCNLLKLAVTTTPLTSQHSHVTNQILLANIICYNISIISNLPSKVYLRPNVYLILEFHWL